MREGAGLEQRVDGSFDAVGRDGEESVGKRQQTCRLVGFESGFGLGQCGGDIRAVWIDILYPFADGARGGTLFETGIGAEGDESEFTVRGSRPRQLGDNLLLFAERFAWH